VYFARIDGEDGLLQQNIARSNYVKDGRAYLLNARPGTYVVVGAFFLPPMQAARSTYTTYFSKELVEQSKVTIQENDFIFMGRYVVDTSVGLDGADEVQTHYKNVVAPGEATGVFAMSFAGAIHYRGALRERKSDEQTRSEFFQKAKDDLAGSGWAARISAGAIRTGDSPRAPIQRSSSYQEGLVGGFDPKEWTVGHQASDQNQRIFEFVRPGEKIDNWTELLTFQVLRKAANPEPIDAMVGRIHGDVAKLCPNGFVQNVIAQGFPTEIEEASIIYEWKVTKCPPHTDQHEVARVMYGKFSIFRLAYVAKTANLASEKREKWIKDLKGARIMVSKN